VGAENHAMLTSLFFPLFVNDLTVFILLFGSVFLNIRNDSHFEKAPFSQFE